MIESSVGSRLTALNVGRSGATSRSSHSRVTANGGATATRAAFAASRGAAAAASGEAANRSRSAPGSVASTTCAVVSAAVVGLDPPPVPLGRCQRPDRRAGAHGGAVLVQVRGERRPDAGQVVGVGRVEADALGVAEEVVVEHRDQLAGRQRPRLGEERAGERLEQHRLGAVRHAQAGQELRGRHVVEPGGGPLAVVGQQLGRQPGVGAEQVAQAEAGGAGEQGQQVQRRRRRQAGEVLGRPGARQHRVAADRPQEAQLRVDPPQDRPPGVVVPEERVEAVLDDLVGAVRQRVRPGAEPAAEGRRGLQQGDRDPALGEHHGRADPGDPAADDDGLGAVRHGAGPTGVGGDDGAGPHPQGRGAGGERGGAEHGVQPRCLPPAARSGPPCPRTRPANRERTPKAVPAPTCRHGMWRADGGLAPT